MTNREAISFLEYSVEYLYNCPKEDEVCEALSMAKDALEYQIEADRRNTPQKPYYLQYDGNPKIGNYHCPACRLIIDLEPIDHNKKTFCLHCGQAIDWSDEE